MTKKIWANVLVKNEDRYLWFAIMSVIDLVDKVLVWDTGSQDNTLLVIQDIQKKYPQKIVFEEKGPQSAQDLSRLRQAMLEASRTDWILILDGDEVWSKESLQQIYQLINHSADDLYALVNPTFNLIGDIYHYQPDAAGKYKILGRTGHLNIRLINKHTPGLHVSGVYPDEGFYNKDNILIQNLDQHLQYIDLPLFHFTHLSRSTKFKNFKYKYEIGNSFSKEFQYPEALSQTPPEFVPSPWLKAPKSYIVKAAIQTPLKKFKRKITRN